MNGLSERIANKERCHVFSNMFLSAPFPNIQEDSMTGTVRSLLASISNHSDTSLLLSLRLDLGEYIVTTTHLTWEILFMAIVVVATSSNAH